MSLSYVLMYTFIVFLATIIPGPSMILALNHGLKYGTKRTLATGMGNLTANLILATISIIGLGALILASTTAFTVIKWIGAAYLIYIGLRAFFSAPIANTSKEKMHFEDFHTKKRLFLNGFLVGASNPKGIIFFTALFPQFIHARENTFSQFSLLLLILAIIALGCFMLYALFGARLNRFFAQSKLGKLFNKFTGLVFVSFGIGLLFSKS